MHLYDRFKDRFGTAGVVIAVIALVAALGGTALAAGALTGKQKKEVEKIAKRFAGKNGAPGAPGAPGEKGPKGDPGQNGTNGAPGKDGESVEVNAYAGSECEEAEGEAGVELTNASGTAYACGGKQGSPWTAGGTLPSNSTETGTWALGSLASGALPGGGRPWMVPISFPVPLAGDLTYSAEPSVGQVHIVLANGKELDESGGFAEITPPHCPGSAAQPEADPGNLCVYITSMGAISEFQFLDQKVRKAGQVEGAPEVTPNIPGASTAGAVLTPSPVAEHAFAFGTWAVTAE